MPRHTRFARGIRPNRVFGQMNKTEQAYADLLEERRKAGEVLWWKYEAVKLRLADKTFYTPDFAVLFADGSFELHETKGFWEDAAKIKIKVAAEAYPFRFRAFRQRSKKDGGGWDEQVFGEAGE